MEKLKQQFFAVALISFLVGNLEAVIRLKIITKKKLKQQKEQMGLLLMERKVLINIAGGAMDGMSRDDLIKKYGNDLTFVKLVQGIRKVEGNNG